MSERRDRRPQRRPYRWRIVQYYQVLAQVGGVFSAASLTLGIFLVGQWQTSPPTATGERC